MCTPPACRGTRIMDCCLCGGAWSSVRPITMRISQPGFIAPDDHHFVPLIT